ncbi:unnamed protein product, partial [Ectocarpus sp. 12 AP-2014]
NDGDVHVLLPDASLACRRLQHKQCSCWSTNRPLAHVFYPWEAIFAARNTLSTAAGTCFDLLNKRQVVTMRDSGSHPSSGTYFFFWRCPAPASTGRLMNVWLKTARPYLSNSTDDA